MEADFSGYATKAGLKCSDGRTIMPGAFRHQDGAQVPLVWQHTHNSPEHVLGHAILEDRDDGVYVRGFLNNSEMAKNVKELLRHGDIKMLSIWANELMERSSRVIHGAIKEVSLVIAGANPGALIDNITIRHSDGSGEEIVDEEAIITSGEEIELPEEEENVSDDNGGEETPASDGSADSGTDDESGTDDADTSADNSGSDDTGESSEEEPVSEGGEVAHADGDSDEETLEDIFETLNPKQKNLLYHMVNEAANAGSDDSLEQSGLTTTDSDTQKGTEMTHNAFEDDATKGYVLTHADITGIVADGMKNGSLKDAAEAFALKHGIDNIDTLFPDAKNVTGSPEWISRRTEWVTKVLGAARKSPFSKIKTMTADITEDEARAKGYITGTLKKEEFFTVNKRETSPTTVYKKQKLDRDDLLDITDFDVVAWLKAEMRLMLDEEIARAILIGDGRDISSEDKINEQNIRPIAKDHELYTTVLTVNLDDSSSSIVEMIDQIILNRHKYKGTGLPTMFTTETTIAKFLLLKDTLGRRIYKTLEELANELRVREIVPVEVMEEEPDILAILVNMDDYVLGATAGGQVTMFDDFDIDYNQQKYLIETRLCGALVKPKAAIVVKKTEGSNILVAPNEPTWDDEAGELSIVDQTGVVYKDSDDNVLNATGSPYAVDPGESITVIATPASGYYFGTSDGDTWTYTN